MHVIYRVNGNEQTIEVEVADDLKMLLEQIEVELRLRHTEMNKDAAMLVRVADGLLNALADDQGDIDLGELVIVDGQGQRRERQERQQNDDD